MNNKGKHNINVCIGTTCASRGSKEILEEFEKTLNINEDEMTKDGKFSLNSRRCMGACVKGPVITINGRMQNGIVKEEVKAIIENCD